jgi:predicted outer membrane repeat protein
MHGLMTLLLIGLGLAGTGRTALAATVIQVTNTDNDGTGSLRAAVASAQSGDTIVFAIPSGAPGCTGSACTITLTNGEIRIDKDLTITGPGAAVLTVQRDPNYRFVSRIFKIEAGRTVAISGLTITRGRLTTEQGAGIYNSGTLTLTNSTLSDNVSTDPLSASGGGIYNSGVLTVDNSIFENNVAGGGGGAIATRNVMTLTNSMIANNRAGAVGAGIFVSGLLSNKPRVVIGQSTISGNSTTTNRYPNSGGGAINNQTGDLVVINSTISNNSSTTRAGAINNEFDGVAVVINSTITGNTAALGADSLNNTHNQFHQSPMSVKNSIVAKADGRTAGAGCAGPVTLAGNNLSNDGSCAMPTGSLALGTLQDNGGLTRTQALGSGSAAIDAGPSGGCTDAENQALTVDQRGIQRPFGDRCDLGAFELTSGSTPPFISPIGNLSIVENHATGPIPFSVSDPDVPGPSAHLSVVAKSNNPGLLPNGNIVVTPSTGPAGARSLTASPLADTFGVATITLTVTDGDGQSAETHFDLTVTPINRPPLFTGGGNVTVLKDSGAYSQVWATSISAGRASEIGQALTFNVINNNASLFSTPPAIAANGTLTFRPASNARGSATVTVKLLDDDGTANGGSNTSTQQQFTLAVTAVNDRPSFSPGLNVSVPMNSGAYQQPWALGISAGPSDESTQALTFQVGASDTTLFSVQPAVALDGALTFAPAAGVTGTATVSVVLSDNGGTDNGGADRSVPVTFTIGITPPNKPPTGTVDSYAVAFNTTLNIAERGVLANDTDPENQSLTAVKVKDPTHGSLSLNPNGSFSYIPTTGYSGTDGFSYRATDGLAESAEVAVTLTVAAPVRCAPRPNPTMRSEQIGPGRLRVTLTTQTNAGLTSNAFQQVVFGRPTNARVEAPGAAPDNSGGLLLVPPAGTQTTTFVLQRQAPGAFQVELTIVDGCGATMPFRTLVGGGAGVQ